MTVEEFDALLAVRGWNDTQVARVLHYNRHTPSRWRDRGHICPATSARLDQWAASLEPLPDRGSRHYAATPQGLRRLMRERDLNCREIAEFCRVHETSVYCWSVGRHPIPCAIAAWLRAGGPPLWQWDPGLPAGEGTISAHGKPQAPPYIRPAPPKQRRASTTVEQYARHGRTRILPSRSRKERTA